MKANKKLEEALGRLADQIENGHVLAEMLPIDFIEAVTMKIVELKNRAEVAEWALDEIEKDRKNAKYVSDIDE